MMGRGLRVIAQTAQKLLMKILIVKFAMWLQERAEALQERFDTCCYPGCHKRATRWCETGGHRHCDEHESNFYNDVDFCMVCWESMTPEEIATVVAEAIAHEEESFAE